MFVCFLLVLGTMPFDKEQSRVPTYCEGFLDMTYFLCPFCTSSDLLNSVVRVLTRFWFVFSVDFYLKLHSCLFTPVLSQMIVLGILECKLNVWIDCIRMHWEWLTSCPLTVTHVSTTLKPMTGVLLKVTLRWHMPFISGIKSCIIVANCMTCVLCLPSCCDNV